MDVKRNNKETRAFMEWRCLPVGWVITQTHFGSYLKIEDINDGYRTVFQGQKWAEVVAFCEGVLAAPIYNNSVKFKGKSGTFKTYKDEKGI